eukprot:4841547-Amphidinium_carterae.2
MIPAPIVITSFKHASDHIAITSALVSSFLAEGQEYGKLWAAHARLPQFLRSHRISPNTEHRYANNNEVQVHLGRRGSSLYVDCVLQDADVRLTLSHSLVVEPQTVSQIWSIDPPVLCPDPYMRPTALETFHVFSDCRQCSTISGSGWPTLIWQLEPGLRFAMYVMLAQDAFGQHHRSLNSCRHYTSFCSMQNTRVLLDQQRWQVLVHLHHPSE